MVSYKNLFFVLSATIASTPITSCVEAGSQNNSNSKKNLATEKDANPIVTPASTQQPVVADDPVTISCLSCASLVKLNQSTTWQFSAKSSSGKNIEVKISPITTVQDFVVTGPIVRFTPKQTTDSAGRKSNSELNGSLKVEAVNNGKVYTQVFSWGSENGNGQFLKSVGSIVISELTNAVENGYSEEYPPEEDDPTYDNLDEEE